MFPEDRFLEILIIGALALIVIGPKDLPVVMRKLGQFVAKMRGMAAEFRASFDELARQSELDELRKEVEALRTSAYASGSPAAAEPVHDYTPFDDAASGLDNAGFSFPPQPDIHRPPVDQAPIMAEALPPAEAEAPTAKPARKPRPRKDVAAPAGEIEAELQPTAGEAPEKPARKPRARRPAPAEPAAARDAAARDAAE